MNTEERIHFLENKVDHLSKGLDESRWQIQQLQKEISVLKAGGTDPKNDLLPGNAVRWGSGLEHFIGLRLIHLTGIIVLVAGLSIGVKYAIDGELISEKARIILAYAACALLSGLAFWLRKKYQLFSAILFSGSMASAYFTTYAAFTYYHFFSGGLAFILMVAITLCTVWMALRYDRQEIAVVGMVGAYGVPFLISANSERADLFLSYVLLINIGVVYLSFRKSWKIVGVLAMLISWALFTGWALFRYEPSQQALAILFMLVYYGLFFLSVLLQIKREEQPASWSVQQAGMNNLGVYLAALFVLEGGASSVFIVAGAAAIVLAAVFFLPGYKMLQRLLFIQFLAVLLLFTGFRFEGLTVTLLWVVVSVLSFIGGVAAKKSWLRLAAVFVMALTLCKLLLFDRTSFTAIQKIVSYIAIGVMLLLFSFYYQKPGLGIKDEKQ